MLINIIRKSYVDDKSGNSNVIICAERDHCG